MSYLNDKAIFTHRQSLARMIQHIFSNSHQNCSEIVSVNEILSNKMNVKIGQRISRLGKSRKNCDFLPLCDNAAFFSMRGNLKTRLFLHNPILSAPLCTVTSRGKREPTGNKVYNVRVMIFLGVFFFNVPNSHNMFFPQHIQMN